MSVVFLIFEAVLIPLQQQQPQGKSRKKNGS